LKKWKCKKLTHLRDHKEDTFDFDCHIDSGLVADIVQAHEVHKVVDRDRMAADKAVLDMDLKSNEKNSFRNIFLFCCDQIDAQVK
jgi:hypothetical protein